MSKQLLKNHLEGVGPQLGIAPLRKDGTCKWGAIDIDKNNYDYKELLNKIREKNFPLIMFRSKSGRAHVYMFMKDFYSAEEVKLVMNKFAAKLGIADILDRVYPMQINLENNTNVIKGINNALRNSNSAYSLVLNDYQNHLM